jgi:hypothetical protein
MNSQKPHASAGFRLTAALLSALLVGCTPVRSLQPLCTRQQAVTEEWLEGAWELENQRDTLWVFRSDGDGGYRLTITDDKSTIAFRVCLVRLNGYLFLDAVAQAPEPDDPFHVPAHLIGRIWVQRDEVRIRMLSEEWATERARNGTLGLSHSRPGGTDAPPVLTGTTAELQQFAVLHAEDAEAFAIEQRLLRWK